MMGNQYQKHADRRHKKICVPADLNLNEDYGGNHDLSLGSTLNLPGDLMTSCD
jgi:hypothetical protein